MVLVCGPNRRVVCLLKGSCGGRVAISTGILIPRRRMPMGRRDNLKGGGDGGW